MLQQRVYSISVQYQISNACNVKAFKISLTYSLALCNKELRQCQLVAYLLAELLVTILQTIRFIRQLIPIKLYENIAR